MLKKKKQQQTNKKNHTNEGILIVNAQVFCIFIYTHTHMYVWLIPVAVRYG